MLVWIMILGITGLILLITEAFIPGFGVFGILGISSLLISTILSGMKYGFGVFLIMIAILIILLLLFIRFAESKKDKFILSDVLDTKDFDESVLKGLEGKKGITITTIRPFGKMEVDGKQIDVCSEGGYIEKNKMVQIIQIKGKTVIVKQIETN